jgi:hypothetical protein
MMGREEVVPEDLRIIDSGAKFTDDGLLDYLWFDCIEDERRVRKVVKLGFLRYIPKETREQRNILEKMRKVLKACYNAQVDFIYLVCGIFNPPIGIVQCYGVQAVEEEMELAVERAREGYEALVSWMANFEQSRLEALPVEKAEWIRKAFLEMPYASTVIGHPDPREEIRGMDARGEPAGARVSEVGLQQNEYLFRGMAKGKHEFLNVVIASRVEQDDIFLLQERVSQELSNWASRERFTRSVSVGLALPVILTGVLSRGGVSGYGESEATSSAETEGEIRGRARTEGRTFSETWGEAETRGESWGTSTTEATSTSVTKGKSHTVGESSGVSRSETLTEGTSKGSFTARSETKGFAKTSGWARVTGSSHTTGVTSSVATTSGETHGVSRGPSGFVSASGTIGKGVVPGGIDVGVRIGGSYEWSDGSFSSQTHSTGFSELSSSFSSEAVSGSTTESHSFGTVKGESQSSFSSRGVTEGTSKGRMTSDSTMESTTTTKMTSTSHFSGGFRSRTTSYAKTEGNFSSETESEAFSKSKTTGATFGFSRSQSLISMRATGLLAGISPSVSLSKTYQGQDRAASLVADALRGQEALLNTIALEGGFFVDNYFLLRTPEGRAALEGLVPLAFHGTEEVVVPVRTRRLPPEVEKYIRLHAMTFTPSTRREETRWALEPYKDTSILTMLQTATYTSPGVFEEGATLTVQERIPPFAFEPQMGGSCLLGHFYSYETGELTECPVKLPRERMANWLFAADTRFGKSVAAERLTLEIMREWHFRCVVLDFGFGWRKLMRLVPRERFTYYGLYPESPRPIRWNPLQIAKRISPERQLVATCELFRNAGRMGERQLGFMRRALRKIYLEAGVLVDDPNVQMDERWGKLDELELRRVNEERRRRGLPPREEGCALADCERWERQTVAIERSKKVDIVSWYLELKAQYDALPVRDITNRTAIEGILLRMESLSVGELQYLYGRGEGSIAIEDLSQPWGMTIIEGGAEMDEFAKSVLLSLIGWHLYADCVVRRREEIGGKRGAPLWLLYEEGNKVITGVETPEERRQSQVASIIQSMFRDAGKYDIYLGVIAQTPSEFPKGIVSSCNNIVSGQLKNPEDRDVILAAMGFSEKGFHYVDYANFIERMAQGMMMLKLGLSPDIARIQPMLFRPLLVRAEEPTDDELREEI